MTQISVNGLTGDMTFDENGEPNKSAKVVVIKMVSILHRINC